MYRATLITSVILASVGMASAADLPSRVAAVAPYSKAPVFTWTGFYVGLNAGAGFNTKRSPSVTTSVPLTVYSGAQAENDTPFTGGVTAGYNMQFGSLVAGVEADINYLRRSGGGAGAFPAPVDLTGGYDNRSDFAVGSGSRNDWFGTVRGRLGFAFDRALIYATGGVAFSGRENYSMRQRDVFETTAFNPILLGFGPSGAFVTNPAQALSSSGSRSNVGWALGAGGEYAITDAMSLKLEYLHVDLGRSSQTFVTAPNAANVAVGQPAGATYAGGDRITVRQKNQFDLVRAGVNVRF